MSVTGIRNRLGQLEDAAGLYTPQYRTIFANAGQSTAQAVAAARLAPDVIPLVVHFVAAKAA
jgi:hypothetical protein